MTKQTTIAHVECADVSAQSGPTDKATIAALDAIRDRIKSRSANYRIETGRDLLRAKKLLPHGEFGPWLKANLSHLSESTAQNYMNVAMAADKAPEIEKLTPTAAIAFAAPNTPNSVRSEIVAEIKTGNVPSAKTVKAKIASAKAPKPAPASATVTALPTKEDAAATPKASDNSDLVERLRAAGLDAARMAFEAAFPGYAVTDLDELDATIERERAA